MAKGERLVLDELALFHCQREGEGYNGSGGGGGGVVTVMVLVMTIAMVMVMVTTGRQELRLLRAQKWKTQVLS